MKMYFVQHKKTKKFLNGFKWSSLRNKYMPDYQNHLPDEAYSRSDLIRVFCENVLSNGFKISIDVKKYNLIEVITKLGKAVPAHEVLIVDAL